MADRFHLLQNLSDALKKVLERNYKIYKKVVEKSSSLERCDINNAQVPATPALPVKKSPGYNNRVIKMEEIKKRHLNGKSVRKIAISVKLNRETVAKYLRLEEPPEKSLPKKFDFSEFTDQILEIIRTNEGTTGKYLIDELRKMGYSGGQTTAYKFIKENFNLQDGTPVRPLNRSLYFPTRAALLLSKSPSKLSPVEKDVVNNLFSAVPDIRQACVLSRQFRSMLVLKKGNLTKRLENWMEIALKCTTPEIRSFAKGILSDFTAVHNAILLKWSNGQVEGQINKLKTVKRQIYGRCRLELLKCRLVMQLD